MTKNKYSLPCVLPAGLAACAPWAHTLSASNKSSRMIQAKCRPRVAFYASDITAFDNAKIVKK